MKLLFISLVALLVTYDSQAQVVAVAPADTTVRPPTKVNDPQYYQIKVSFTLSKSIPEKDTFLIASANNIIPFDAIAVKLPNERLQLSQAEVRTLNGGSYVTKIVLVEITQSKDLQKDEWFSLTIQDSKIATLVKISRVGLYDGTKPFWVEAGANFDLIDGLSANNFYSGIFLYRRDIKQVSFRKRANRKFHSNNLALFTGIYESKTVSEKIAQDVGLVNHYNQNSILLRQGSDYGVFTDLVSLVKTQVIRNLSLFFSPQIRLTNGSSNESGFHVFASLWVELQWQRVQNRVDSLALTRMDTLYVAKEQLGDYSLKKFNNELDVRSHYFGLGLPIFFKEGDVHAFFNPAIGMSNQPRAEVLDEEINLIARKWTPFYFFQFRLNEERYGIAFTGEVRGLIKSESRPFVSLALSKKFDLTKLIEYK